MSQFRAKRLDIGGFINARIIRDHTKRKVFEQYEPERYVFSPNAQTHSKRKNMSRELKLTFFLASQTGAPLHNPQHYPPSTCPRTSPTPTLPDARLYPVNADQEQMCGWWNSKECFPGF